LKIIINTIEYQVSEKDKALYRLKNDKEDGYALACPKHKRIFVRFKDNKVQCEECGEVYKYVDIAAQRKLTRNNIS